MAQKNFTQFDLKTSILTGDFLVGYKEDGTAEFRASIKDILKNVPGYEAQTLSFNEGTRNLSIALGNTVSLSSLNTTFINNSSKYESTYNTVTNTSSDWNLGYSRATAYSNTSATFTTNTVTNNLTSLLTPLTLTNTLTGQLVTNTVFANYQSNVANTTATLLPTTIYQNASGNWQNTFTSVQSNSANWQSTFTNVQSNSANLQSTFTNVQSNSANWQSTFTNVQSNSANWQSTFTNVQSNSANLQSTFTNVQSNSANWQSTYLTVSALSAAWEESADIIPTVTNYLSSNTVTTLRLNVNTLITAASALITSHSISATSSPNIILNAEDSGRTYQLDTTTSSITVSFPNTLPNGFTVNLINSGTGTIFLSSVPTINAAGTQNTTPYSGMYIYKLNNQLIGLGVFV